MDAILNFEGNSIKIKEFGKNKKRAEAGEPDNTAFVLRVESAVGFAGTSHFICDINGFRRFIMELRNLYQKRIISAKLVDQSLGSYILFKMGPHEIYTVKGMLVGSDGEHILKYEFGINRQEIFPFTRQLCRMAGESHEIPANQGENST